MPDWSHGTGRWELYDLSADAGETKDLSREQPEKLQELLVLWTTMLKRPGSCGGSALGPLPVETDTDHKDLIGGDPVEDTRAWMPGRGRSTLVPCT